MKLKKNDERKKKSNTIAAFTFGSEYSKDKKRSGNWVKRTRTVTRVEDLSGYFACYRTGIVVSTPTFYHGRQPRKKQILLQAFQGQTSLSCESFDFKLKMSGWENCFHISSHTLPLPFFFFNISFAYCFYFFLFFFFFFIPSLKKLEFGW